MDSVRVFCSDTGEYHVCKTGATLLELINSMNYTDKMCDDGIKRPILAAYVDNRLKSLDFKLYMAHSITFLTIADADGRRTYMRSLSFLLQKAVKDIYGDKYQLALKYSLPNGLYGELYCNNGQSEDSPNGRLPEITNICDEDIASIKKRMHELVERDIPFIKTKDSNEDAVRLFMENGQREKAGLAKGLGYFFITTYYLDGYGDTFYGPLLYSTGYLKEYDLVKYNCGFCLQFPEPFPPYSLPEKVIYQENLYEIFKENSDWCAILGARDIGTVNYAIQQGHATELIQISEALHERKYAAIADRINARRGRVKLVLIAGPSSSGKTTTSKRIAVQLKVLGLNPVVIAMDNYFLNREQTPKDSDGNYDFENLRALDLDLLNRQLNQLFNGEQVELPKFDFAAGVRYYDGQTVKMEENDILIMEGIHALNPQLTSEIDDEKKFKIYASALTSLAIDENNCISTTDNRLLRRLVRDNNFRGTSAEETILRWNSVRKGEYRNIFPYQENADVMFNSFLIYELPLLKYYAEPLLRRISPASAAYSESLRLIKFLSYIINLDPKEQKGVPPNSVLREFIGESTFTY